MARKRRNNSGLVDPYRDKMSRADLEQIRRTYAKRVNQRILRLERSGHKVNEPVTEYLQQIGRRRFSETGSFGGTLQQLRREISALTGFLESKRSTVSGWKEISKTTQRTMKERYGVDLSRDEMEYLLNNFNDFKEAVSMNSDALLQAIGEVSGQIDSKQKIDKIIKELRNKRSVQEQAAAIYKAAYGRRRTGRADLIENIADAIIR